MKRVLVMGSGLVAKPLLDHLLARGDVEVRVATLDLDRAARLLGGHPKATAARVDATDQEALRQEVSEADVVVSLLPANQHILIADACLERRRPLVTTSYVSDSFGALDGLARERGVLFLGECGLDPGIDHMTAVVEARRIQDEGGTVVSFASYCGGLPAPSANTNPWGYKFAWSPRAVVIATRNPVRYLERGRVVSQQFPEYFEAPRALDVPGVGRLEAYPNRDCLRYIEAYGLDGVESFFRGTLRYAGWCETWCALHQLGLLHPTRPLAEHGGFAASLGALAPGAGPLRDRVAATLGVPTGHPVVERLAWLGLFDDEPVAGATAALDALVRRLAQRLAYEPGEHDMVVLEHRIDFVDEAGQRRRRVQRLIVEGDAGDDSAMARTVGLPAGLACSLILDGRTGLTGVRIPTHRELALPILRGLERAGLRFSLTDEAAPAA